MGHLSVIFKPGLVRDLYGAAKPRSPATPLMEDMSYFSQYLES